METLAATKYCALAKQDDGTYLVSSTIGGVYQQVGIDEDYAFDLMDIAENQGYWLDAYVLSELQAAKKQKNRSYHEHIL
jgi:hypothetical protein